MKKLLVAISFPIVFLGAGIGMLYSLGIFQYFPYKYAEGTVIYVGQGNKANQVTLTVTFQTEDKQTVNVVSNGMTDLKDMPTSHLGQNVRVYYTPNNPSKAFVNESTIAFSFAFFFVGLAALSMFIKFVIDYFTPLFKMKQEQNLYIFKRKNFPTFLGFFDEITGLIISICSFFIFGEALIWFLQNPDIALLKNQSFNFYLLFVIGIMCACMIVIMLFKKLFSKKEKRMFDTSTKTIYLKNDIIPFKNLKKMVIAPTHINMGKKNDPDGFGLSLVTANQEFLFIDGYFEKNVEHYALLINNLLGDMKVIVEKTSKSK